LKQLPTRLHHGSISGVLSDLQLRHLVRDEWQVLRDVRLSALRESPQSFLANYDQEERYGKERWQAEFDRGDWIVGELDGKHVCLTGITRESGAPADERYLEYVWVAPGFRRRGVAFDLLTEIIDELRESGVRTVFLWTLHGDNPARLLYRRLDFVTVNLRQKLGADPEKRWWEWLRRDLI
jgi:ribosomal protein S18 acetylase RimI-like enzyme